MEANWRPLEERLKPAQCVGFMFMGRLNGVTLYKHGLSRRHLNLGDDGRAYRYVDCGRFAEIPFEKALSWVVEPLAAMGETLETPCEEEYKARRSTCLRAAGGAELRMQVQPENIAGNSLRNAARVDG